MDIDFKKVMEEDAEFKDFAKDVTLDVFATFNPHLIGTIWSLYQANMEKDKAAFTLKMIIRNSSPPPSENKQ